MRQARRDAAARLRDIVFLFRDWFGDDSAVVLVAPHDEIDAVVKHAFRDRVLRPVLDAAGRASVGVSAEPKRTEMPRPAPTDFDARAAD